MDSLLTQFCADFEQVVRPIAGPIADATRVLDATLESLPVSGLDRELIELQHQVDQLAARVADQRACTLVSNPANAPTATHVDNPGDPTAFLDDSLRSAAALFQQSRYVGGDPRVRVLALEVDDLGRRCAAQQARLQVTGRLFVRGWQKRFDEVRAALRAEAERQVETIDRWSQHDATAVIERWFQSSDGLGPLRAELQSLRVEYQRAVVLIVEQVLAQRVCADDAGLSLASSTANDLRRIGIDLVEIARAALDQIDRQSLVVDPPPLQLEQIPIRRRWTDWLLFRGRARLTTRIFGQADQPTVTVSRENKARRLNCEAFAAQIDELRAGFAKATLQRLTDHFYQGHTQRTCLRLSGALSSCQADAEERIAELLPMLDSRRGVLAALESLRVEAQAGLRAIDELSNRYRDKDLADLLQPIAPVLAAGLRPGEGTESTAG